MRTNRRTVLKNLLLASAGIVLVPSCSRQPGKASIVLQHLDMNREDEEWLAEVCETLIPATGTPGAKDIGAHLFVLKMVDDCVGENEQRQFEKGLAAFRRMFGKTGGGSFLHAALPERADLFKKLENKNGVSPELDTFYTLTKKYTVQAYTSSQYFLTNVRIYELVPGRFHGCVPIDKKTI